MAMTTCGECGHKISTTAKACPQCGAAQSRTSPVTYILGGIFTLFVASCVWNGYQADQAQEKAAIARAAAEAKLTQEQRAAADARKAAEQEAGLRRGAAAVAAKHLRDAMHDPKSFQLEQAIVMADGAACYTYRANNGFGALRRHTAVLTLAGSMLTSDAHGDAFAAAWKKACTGRTGEDIAAYVNRAVL